MALADHNPPSDDLKRHFDAAWKDFLSWFPDLFFSYFFPELHGHINWEVPLVELDPELRPLFEQSKAKTRIADKLLRVRLRDGTNLSLIIHLEFQNQPDPTLPRRMYEMNYRLSEYLDEPVVDIAVLGDESPSYRPSEYREETFGCVRLCKYRVIKLIDWRGREAELEQIGSPISLLILTHLRSHETHADHESRYQKKFELIRTILQGGETTETIRKVLSIVEQLMTLPEELDIKLMKALKEAGKENQMPVMNLIERYGYGQGETIGLEKGLQEGLEQGLEKGRLEALRNAVLMLGNGKFGAASEDVGQQLNAIVDTGHLYRLLERIGTVASWTELLNP